MNDCDFSKVFVKSNLVRGNIFDLDEQLEHDKETKKLLFTKASELPKEYSYLMGEIFDGWEEINLYHLIRESYLKLPKNQVFFSKTGDKITGWCAYQTSYSNVYHADVVSEIKMFSFDLNTLNVVLLRDLRTLLDDLVKRYPLVSWVAVKENPANRIYERVIKQYGGYVESNDRLNFYYIETNKED